MMGPFEQHIRDAIALNASRAPRYALLSGGSSRPISRWLILVERALLPVARWSDRRAAPYHRAGIPLLGALFAPMESAPAFASARSPLGLMRNGDLLTAPIRRRVRAAYRARGFEGAAHALMTEIATLADAPATDCVVRHLLESAHRLSALAPEQIRLAGARGLASPRWLLAFLFRLHLWGLSPAGALDSRARPLQARGIPILAQDLPPVPPPPRTF